MDYGLKNVFDSIGDDFTGTILVSSEEYVTEFVIENGNVISVEQK